ncbi:hypothetical protein, partial [Brachyspira hampsonii]
VMRLFDYVRNADAYANKIFIKKETITNKIVQWKGKNIDIEKYKDKKYILCYHFHSSSNAI